MVNITVQNVKKELFAKDVVLFGAGSTGKKIYKLLGQYGIKILYFVDDDNRKVGEYIQGIKVISYDQFLKYCVGVEKVFVMMSSIYGKEILNRLSKIKNVVVYEMYEWYSNSNGQKSCIVGCNDVDEIEKFGNEFENLARYMQYDQESVKIYRGLYCYLKKNDLNYISEICTEKEQYFPNEILDVIKKPLEIIDAGAYEGELSRVITKFKIPLNKWYCFEADEENYKKMLNIKTKSTLADKQICINKGLWLEEKVLYFSKADTASKITNEVTDCKIEVTSIDNYFKNITFNFIKMDIEGSEYPALLGGLNAIKRERPIMAISIYHSLEDFFRIPRLLKKNLDNYCYFVRHHSLIFAETVLYAIPNELF